MKFAILGLETENRLLAEAALRAGHEVVWCGDMAGEVPSWWQAEDWGHEWETLLDQSTCDAVLLGNTHQVTATTVPIPRMEQFNQLAKAGTAVLTTFPLGLDLLPYYEIDMARSESGAIVQHFNPLVVRDDLISEWRAWTAHGHADIGPVEQIVWDRPLADRSRERVLRHFARDVELLTKIAGSLNRLGAHGSPDERATYSALSVQLLGEQKLPVRWAVGPAEAMAAAQLTFVGEHGKLRLTLNEWGQATRSECVRGDDVEVVTHESNAARVADLAVSRFVAAVESDNPESSTWLSALRAMELADTIEISLRRGRMMDVHHQQLSEQLSFKGTMSAVGCGVLVLLPPLLLAAGWLAEQVGLPVANYWPHLLLALLAFFLLFQVVPKLLFAPRKDSDGGALPEGDTSRDPVE